MLKNPKKADLDKDGKLSSYEKRRGMAIEKNMKVKKANKGMSVKGDNKRDIRKVEEKIGASRSSKREKKIMKAALGAIALGAIGAKGLSKIMKKKASASPTMGAASEEKNKFGMTPLKTLYQKSTEQKKARTGKMMKANVGMAAKKVREKEIMKASMGKSVRGYGAARTSGMGLQDESLPPGKSLDYYKDLM